LYPLHVDASGCKYEDPNVPETPQQVIEAPGQNPGNLQKRALADIQGRQVEEGHLEDLGRANMGNAMRESLVDSSGLQALLSVDPVHSVAKCEPQGLIPSICTRRKQS
jgi:hypothetical protein